MCTHDPCSWCPDENTRRWCSKLGVEARDSLHIMVLIKYCQFLMGHRRMLPLKSFVFQLPSLFFDQFKLEGWDNNWKCFSRALVVAFYSDDLSLNLAEVYKFSVKLLFKRTKINKKRPALDHLKNAFTWTPLVRMRSSVTTTSQEAVAQREQHNGSHTFLNVEFCRFTPRIICIG